MPKWREVADALSDRIERGHVKGDKLPNWRDIRAEYGVSDGTLRRALDYLTQLGIIRREHGKAILVESKPSEAVPLSDGIRPRTLAEQVADHERRLRALEEEK